MGRDQLAAQPITKARTRPALAPSRVSAPLLWLGRFCIAPYLRLALRFTGVDIRCPEKILEPLRAFQGGRARLIVAFRHAYGDEPQLLFHVFNNLLPRLAKKGGKPLLRRPHLRFVHGYEVPLWGGPLIRFILPRVGAVPVYHARFDAGSLKAILDILDDDPCPLALAPEGQISYHSETLPRIEQGTLRLGLWCARDMEKAGRGERVLVLPLSIHYRYDPRDVGKLRAILARLEGLCGLPAPAGGKAAAPEDLLPRMDAVEDRLLAIAEAYYAETYGYGPEAAATRHGRWEGLQQFALAAAERLLGMDAPGENTVQRMYRIRLEGWNRIYPQRPEPTLPPLAAALAHRRAAEAWHAMRHMEFVDLMHYHDDGYLACEPGDGPGYDRITESMLTLSDLATRLLGGNITHRPNSIRKQAVLVPGDCLDLSACLADFRVNAKGTMDRAMNDLAARYIRCVKEYRHDTQR